MKTKQWLIENKKLILVVSMIIVCILLLLFVRNCSNNIQDIQNINSAVSHERISELERKIDEKTTQLAESRTSEDSLWVLIKQRNAQLDEYKAKYVNLSNKYAKERNKVKELTNIESVGLFLENTKQSDFPVIQYEDSTKYVIPVSSIQLSNIAFVDLKEQIAINTDIKEESKIKTMQIKNLNNIIDNKEEQITILTEVNKYVNGMVTEKDSQLIAEHKKYKQQKVKTYITGAIGGILVICSLVF